LHRHFYLDVIKLFLKNKINKECYEYNSEEYIVLKFY
jgi:hypothetical protein